MRYKTHTHSPVLTNSYTNWEHVPLQCKRNILHTLQIPKIRWCHDSQDALSLLLLLCPHNHSSSRLLRWALQRRFAWLLQRLALCLLFEPKQLHHSNTRNEWKRQNMFAELNANGCYLLLPSFNYSFVHVNTNYTCVSTSTPNTLQNEMYTR